MQLYPNFEQMNPSFLATWIHLNNNPKLIWMGSWHEREKIIFLLKTRVGGLTRESTELVLTHINTHLHHLNTVHKMSWLIPGSFPQKNLIMTSCSSLHGCNVRSGWGTAPWVGKKTKKKKNWCTADGTLTNTKVVQLCSVYLLCFM